MPANTLCSDIHLLDFSNDADLNRILHQDKHTRIEGLCSEAAFMEDVVADNLAPVTGDFWFTRSAAVYEVTRIVTDVHQHFNVLDYRILDGFATRVPVSVAWFDEVSCQFFGFRHRHGTRYESVDGMGEALRMATAPVIADERERDPERLRKACAYLQQRGLLRDSAIKRLFANCWLGRAVWDIDAFGMTAGGKVVALEVKQKYATARGTFGLNEGQRKLFCFLNSLGMPVVHVVLEKPVNDPAIHAIDMLREVEYTSRTNWLYTRFFPENLKLALSRAPKFTSIFGTSDLAYSHIDREHFDVLKPFGVPVADVAEKLFAGLD